MNSGIKKLKDLESKNYKLVWGNGQGRGTYIIIDKNTDEVTLRNTGSDAINDYAILKKMFNRNKSEFDNYIRIHESFYA